MNTPSPLKGKPRTRWTPEQVETLTRLVTNYRKPNGHVDWERIMTEEKAAFDSLERHQVLCQQKASAMHILKEGGSRGKPRISKRRSPTWLSEATATATRTDNAPLAVTPRAASPVRVYDTRYCYHCGAPARD